MILILNFIAYYIARLLSYITDPIYYGLIRAINHNGMSGLWNFPGLRTVTGICDWLWQAGMVGHPTPDSLFH